MLSLTAFGSRTIAASTPAGRLAISKWSAVTPEPAVYWMSVNTPTVNGAPLMLIWFVRFTVRLGVVMTGAVGLLNVRRSKLKPFVALPPFKLRLDRLNEEPG